MSEDFDWDKYGAEYFETLFNQINNHPNWEYHNVSGTIPDKAEKAQEFRDEEELEFLHTETDGVLNIRSPHLGSGIRPVSGIFGQNIGLSAPMSRNYDSFEEDINEVQVAIAERHQEAEYTGVVEDDPHFDVARFRIPSFNYDEAKVDQALDELDDISREIQDMHDEVYAVFERYE